MKEFNAIAKLVPLNVTPLKDGDWRLPYYSISNFKIQNPNVTRRTRK